MITITPWASGGAMVSKLDKQTFTNEFASHWMPHLYDLVTHLSRKHSKLQPLHNEHLQYVKYVWKNQKINLIKFCREIFIDVGPCNVENNEYALNFKQY